MVLVEPQKPQGQNYMGKVRAIPKDLPFATAQDNSRNLKPAGQQSSFACGLVSHWLADGEWETASLRLLTNRMSESFTSGSVGGAAGNRRFYPAP